MTTRTTAQQQKQAKTMGAQSFTAIPDTGKESFKDTGRKSKFRNIVAFIILHFSLLVLGGDIVLERIQRGISWKLRLAEGISRSQEAKTTIEEAILNDVKLFISLQLVISFLWHVCLLFVIVDTANSTAIAYIGEKLSLKGLLLMIGKIQKRPLMTCFYETLFFIPLMAFVAISVKIFLAIGRSVSFLIWLKFINKSAYYKVNSLVFSLSEML